MKTTIFYHFRTKQNLLFVLFSIFFIGILHAQTTPQVLWAKQFGGENIDSASDMTVDPTGNIYIIGSFQTEITLGDITLTSTSGLSSYVAKTDSSGTILWAKQFDGTFSGGRLGITTDNLGNVYTLGTFTGVVTFDSVTLDSGNQRGIFVLKLDLFGNVIWAKQFGGTSYLGELSFAGDSQGNIYTTGYFYDSITFDGIVLTDSDPDKKNWFVTKQDASGNVLWAKKIGQTADFIDVTKIATDTSDNIYIIGKFSGNLDFDETTLVSSQGDRDFFLVKLNSLGQAIWAKQFEVTDPPLSDYYINDLVIDQVGNIHITGTFRGTLQAGAFTLTSSEPNRIGIFVIKTDSSGETLWAKGFANSNDAYSNSVGINTDTLGNIYVTGYFMGTIDFDGIVLIYSFLPNVFPKGFDAFVVKLNDLGAVEWAVKYGGFGWDYGKSIAISTDENVIVLGQFNLSVNFGGTMFSSFANSQDIFLLKLAADVLATEKHKINSWSVFPNPVDDFLTLNFSDDNHAKLSIEVFDLLGQKIKVFENLSTTETLDLSDLSSGVYLLKIKHNQTTEIIKIKKL